MSPRFDPKGEKAPSTPKKEKKPEGKEKHPTKKCRALLKGSWGATLSTEGKEGEEKGEHLPPMRGVQGGNMPWEQASNGEGLFCCLGGGGGLVFGGGWGVLGGVGGVVCGLGVLGW